MNTKWFQFTPWRSAEDEHANDNANNGQAPAATADTDRAKPAAASAGGHSPSGNDLLPFDEIYRSAGIPVPRMGYTIIKVVDMLANEHIRNMSSETKRGSLLMALEAAGVQVNEVLQDATLRQHALNSYEGSQKKRLEQYEARKAQENREIQAEMDRVTAQYLARINSNLDCVAREKDALRKWQVQKQEEAQRMTDAVGLCVNQRDMQPVDESVIALRELANSVDPAYAKR